MIGAVVAAFLLGVLVGVLIGRRRPAPDRPAVVQPVTLSKQAQKAGLTEDAFKPSDDILEKLRLASEGQLDPSALDDTPVEPEAPAEDPLSDVERRVLDRLRAQDPGSDRSKQRDQDTSA